MVLLGKTNVFHIVQHFASSRQEGMSRTSQIIYHGAWGCTFFRQQLPEFLTSLTIECHKLIAAEFLLMYCYRIGPDGLFTPMYVSSH